MSITVNGNIIKGNARFSVLCEGVIRMEYAKNGAFEDRDTLFAQRGSALYPANVSSLGDTLTVEADAFTLTYTGGEAFSPENLSVRIRTGGVDTTWRFGDKNKNNLGGTLSTLDGVDGFRDVPDGLLSRDGWYVIDDSCTPVLEDGWIKNREKEHLTDIYLFCYGHDYKKALRFLATVSGAMEMPRKYFLGSWYSRWWKYTAEEFLAIADEYDSHGFPLDILVMDMDWHYHDWGYTEGDPKALYGYGHGGGNLGWTGYTWNRRIIPDPEALLGELHRRGIAVTLNDHPCDGIRDHEDTYPEFMRLLGEAGYSEQVPDVTDRISETEKENSSRGVVNYRFNAGSREYMQAFFDSTHSKRESEGVDFWWLDWQQDHIYPCVNGTSSLSHLQWLNYLYYDHSKKGGKRGMSFSRWGGFGDHKHPAYFSGDTVTGWDTLGFEVQMTVTAGNAGCFWWSHDIGGFSDPVEGGQGEVYVRWVQFGALSAALRLHVCGSLDRRPWKWDDKYCSPIREMFRLRSRLMPYIYSAAWESRENSVPLLRPLYIEYPECDEAYMHPGEYFFGSGLIAAPVTKAGEGDECIAESEVWLPDGQWFCLFDGKEYSGGHIVRSDGLYTFPLFVKAGFPLVTRPYTPRMATAPLDELKINIYCPSGDISSETVLFEDDGITDEYIRGRCRKTAVRYDKCGGVHTVTLEPTGLGYDGEVSRRSVEIILGGVDKPVRVIGGISDYIAEKRQARILIPSVPTDGGVTVSVR